jgi:hypothetical protein
MEDVSDTIFGASAGGLGADACYTEFVTVDSLLLGCQRNKRRAVLAEDDRPTAIQIYGADPARLVEAARIAEEAGPAFIDINCGCWVPRIARRGAGAGWLRDPEAMVAMVAQVVRAVSLPVTVKTRIGLGPEDQMPIVELAPRLEDVGVRALTVHCPHGEDGLHGHGGLAVGGPGAGGGAHARHREWGHPDGGGHPARAGGDGLRGHDAGARRHRAPVGVPRGEGAARGPDPGPPTPAERLGLLREHLLANAATRKRAGG